ncbi:hypothetical protein HKCCE2091_06120 [Rhodobacterales bacterium HKCCE2091]|nr:hypothetical protein [Rhodobacterales bacterium HKCCE2091]
MLPAMAAAAQDADATDWIDCAGGAFFLEATYSGMRSTVAGTDELDGLIRSLAAMRTLFMIASAEDSDCAMDVDETLAAVRAVSDARDAELNERADAGEDPLALLAEFGTRTSHCLEDLGSDRAEAIQTAAQAGDVPCGWETR